MLLFFFELKKRFMKTKITLILLLLLLPLLGENLFAQVQLNTAPVSYQPATLAQGGAAGTYKMDVINNNSVGITGTVFTLTLPTGMEYVAGSVTSATENNITNLQKPVFTLNNVAAGSTLAVTFSARINCGYTAGATIGYATAGVNATSSTTSPVASNTPAPTFVFSSVPNPQALSLQLSTNGTRTIKFKNSGNVSVSTVYIESKVVSALQSQDYKVMASNNGVLSTVANGYRITLTGAALKNAITTSVGTSDASFDNGEEITIVLTEQILSCATDASIPLTFKVGTADIKDNFCYSDTSTASIVTPVGNPAISLVRNTSATTWPDFCNVGKTSYTIANTGNASLGAASNLYKIKLPWSSFSTSA